MKQSKLDLNNLSPEILKQLEEIDALDLDKIKSLYEGPQESIHHDHERPGKLIKCPHEIIFTVTARVMEENLKGETIGEKEISIKTFHIPVPIDKDYKSYMSTFFNYLENKMIETIDHSNKEAKEKSYE